MLRCMQWAWSLYKQAHAAAVERAGTKKGEHSRLTREDFEKAEHEADYVSCLHIACAPSSKSSAASA